MATFTNGTNGSINIEKNDGKVVVTAKGIDNWWKTDHTVAITHTAAWCSDYAEQLRRYAGRTTGRKGYTMGVVTPSRVIVDGRRHVEIEVIGREVGTGRIATFAAAVYDLPTIYAMADAFEAVAN